MSQDHKPSREDEAQRIREAGGFIINNRYHLKPRFSCPAIFHGNELKAHLA
jgi:Protein phosphatase 2C